MTDDALEIWGSGTARTFRPLWMAHELDLDFEHIPIGPRTGETKTPAFLALNPRHKVPILRHGELVLTESAAILIYMTEHLAKPGRLYPPDDPTARVKHLEWCFFIMSELDANGLYTMRRHGQLRGIYGDAPVAVRGGREYFLYQLDRMEPVIRAAAPFLMGEKICAADILFTSCLDWALRYEIPLAQHLVDYRERMAARPAYEKARAQNDV